MVKIWATENAAAQKCAYPALSGLSPAKHFFHAPLLHSGLEGRSVQISHMFDVVCY